MPITIEGVGPGNLPGMRGAIPITLEPIGTSEDMTPFP